jgi:hypothetical protein
LGFAPRDHRPQHAPAAHTEHVGDYGAELYVGVFEHFLNALFVLHHLPHQLLARPGQVAQLLDRSRRN